MDALRMSREVCGLGSRLCLAGGGTVLVWMVRPKDSGRSGYRAQAVFLCIDM